MVFVLRLMHVSCSSKSFTSTKIRFERRMHTSSEVMISKVVYAGRKIFCVAKLHFVARHFETVRKWNEFCYEYGFICNRIHCLVRKK